MGPKWINILLWYSLFIHVHLHDPLSPQPAAAWCPIGTPLKFLDKLLLYPCPWSPVFTGVIISNGRRYLFFQRSLGCSALSLSYVFLQSPFKVYLCLYLVWIVISIHPSCLPEAFMTTTGMLYLCNISFSLYTRKRRGYILDIGIETWISFECAFIICLVICSNIWQWHPVWQYFSMELVKIAWCKLKTLKFKLRSSFSKEHLKMVCEHIQLTFPCKSDKQHLINHIKEQY